MSKFGGDAVARFKYEQRNGKYNFPCNFEDITEHNYYRARNIALELLKFVDENPIKARYLGLTNIVDIWGRK